MWVWVVDPISDLVRVKSKDRIRTSFEAFKPSERASDHTDIRHHCSHLFHCFRVGVTIFNSHHFVTYNRWYNYGK